MSFVFGVAKRGLVYWTTSEAVFDSRHEKHVFAISRPPRPAVASVLLPITYAWGDFPGIKWSEREGDYSPTCSVKVTNKKNRTSIHLIPLHGVVHNHTDILILPFALLYLQDCISRIHSLKKNFLVELDSFLPVFLTVW